MNVERVTRRTTSKSNRFIVGAFIAALLAMFVPVLVPAAQAALPSRIVGYAENAATGARLVGIEVDVYSSNTFPGPVASMLTNGSGEFLFDLTDTPADGAGYTVTFTDPADALGFVMLDEIYIQPGYDELMGVIMRPGGRIEGSVTVEGGGALPAGACVEVFEPYSGLSVAGAGDCNLVDGYSTPALSSGGYQVALIGADGEFLVGGFTELVAPGTANVDLVVPAPVPTGTARLLGRVTATGTTNGVEACLYGFDADFNFATLGCTDPDGNYESDPIEPGTYTVSIQPLDQRYKGTSVAGVVVVAGDQTENFQVDRAATIEGVVTLPGDVPVEGATVRMCSLLQPWQCGFERATTAANGSYLINAESFVGQAVAIAFTGANLGWEWHNNVAFTSADGFNPPPGATTVTPVAATAITVNAELTAIAPSSISGTVTDSTTGLPLGGVAVTVARAESGSFGPGYWFTGATTDSTGDYTVTGLEAGDYLVRAATFGYQSERYDDLRNGPGTPMVVSVGVGATAGDIDFGLDPQGVIQGRVTTDADPVSLYGTDFCVTVTPDSGLFNPISECRLLGTSYQIPKLPSGTYTVEVTSDDYATQTITGVEVTTPLTTTRDVVLERLPVISGVVTDDGTPGVPLANVTVCTERADLMLQRCTSTRADGTYAFANVPGTVGVKAQATAYRTEWFDESSAAPGTPFALVDVDVGGVDFTLEARPSVSGRVTVDGAGVCVPVSLLDATSGVSVGFAFTSCAVGPNRGTYTIYAEPGSYKVRFNDTFNAAYVVEFWNDKATFATGDVIVLGAGEAETGIDAVLAESPTISGVVTADGTGLPLANVTVSAYSPGSLNPLSSAFTNALGEYEMFAPQGSYEIRFAGVGYRTEWFANVLSRTDATPVVVDATGGSASASLFALQRISGIVTSEATGAALSNVLVSAIIPSTTTSSVQVFTSFDGSYNLYVEAGSWLVAFDGRQSNHVLEYYDDSSTIDGAALVDATVSSPTGINASLELGGTIAGSLQGSTGFTSACIYAHDAPPSSLFTALNGCSFGNYFVRGVPAGTYRLYASSLNPVDASEWYDGADTYADGANVVVTAGATTTANFTLDPAGYTISGQVVDQGGVGLAGVQVNVRGPMSRGATTDVNGVFSIPGLTGNGSDYSVSFEKAGYVSEYYNDNPTSPTLVEITNASVSLGVVDLDPAPVSVTGVVTELGSMGTIAADPVCVTFTQVFGGFQYGFAYRSCTDELGNYAVGLPEGSFQVSVAGETFPSRYITRIPYTLSTPFAVMVPSAVLDLEIDAGSQLTGRVVQEGTSLGLPSIQINVLNSLGNPVAYGFTDSLGYFTTGGVVDGEYSVRFVNFAGRFISAYLGGDLVSPGQTVVATGLDIDVGVVGLELGSLITGTITDVLGDPVSGACVTASDPVTDDQLTTGCSDSTGAYATAGLPDGTYDLTVSSGGFETATAQVVIAGGDVVRDFVLTAPVPLGPVQNLVATPGNQSVALTWSPPLNPGAGVVEYHVLVDFGFGLLYYDTAGAGTSYTVDVLVNGESYDFAVVAIDSDGAMAQSTPVTAVPNPQPPGQPTAVQTVAGTGQVTVSWTAPDDAGSPLIDSRVQVLKGGTWVWGATALLSSTSATVLGLDGGVEYSFRVRSQNVAGWGPWSSVATATPTAPVASPPTVVQNVTTLAGVGAVTVSWDAPADLGGSPIIDSRVQVFKDGAWKWGATAVGSATSATVLSLVGGTEYQFRVRTQNAAGWSPWSTPVADTPSAATISAPGAIEDVSAFGGFNPGEVDVFWSNPIDDGGEAVSDTRVQVFKGGKWVWGATALGGSTSATVTSLNSGETYSFRARTRNSAGWGPWSAVTTATAT